MKKSLMFILSLLLVFLVNSCQKNQEARLPISQSSGSFIKKSAERNKKLIATEESRIDSVIKSNPKVNYFASTKGYWYSYVNQNTTDTLTPKKGDVAFFTYEIKDLKGKIIYSEAELKPQTYPIDKKNIMTGIREGIKLMHKKEKVIFLFPSNIAYGYHGDNKKIGTNQPLICTITLNDFVPETAFRKEIQLKETVEIKEEPTPVKIDKHPTESNE